MPWWKKEDPPPEPTEPLTERITLRLVSELGRYPPYSVMVAAFMCLEELERQEPTITKPVEDKLLEAFVEFFSYLPDPYCLSADEFRAEYDRYQTDPNAFNRQRKSQPSVSLYDVLKKPGHAILDLAGPFCGSTMKSAGAFRDLRKQLLTNEARASGISYYERHQKKIIGPDEADAAPYDLVEMYLAHTPFYQFLCTRVPFVIPRKAFSEHGAFFGKSGHGKTQSLRAIVAGFLQEDDPPALFIIDGLGSLIEGLDQLEIFATRLKDRLVILDPTDASPPALNLFKLGSNSLYHYLFKSIDQTLTARQATMISNLMLLMQEIEDATLETLIKVCETRENLFPEAVDRLPSVAKSFLLNQVYCKKPDELVIKTKSQVVQRIYAIAGMGKFNEMFSAPENKFDAYRCMQERKIVLINTDARDAEQGGLGEASPVFGRFILAQCLAAARRRPKNERHLALLIVDEAKHYMDEHAALILSDARQYGLGMLLATQFPHQLEEGVRKEINTNTSIKMMGPVEFAVASQYARDMFATPEFIMGMKSYDRSHAEWATYVANFTPRALKLSVPFGAIEKMPQMDAATHAALRAANMARYGASTTTPRRPQPEHPEDARKSPDGPKPADSGEPLIKPGKEW